MFGLYVQKTYMDLLTEQCAIDFNDMVPLTHFLFTTRPEVLAQYRNRFPYVFCDEYQG